MPTLKWGSGKSSFLDKLANESKQTPTQAQITASEESKQEKKVVQTRNTESEKTEPTVSQTEEQDDIILSVSLFELFNR